MDSHGNASQNQMFQSYSAQGGHPGSMGLGVSPQAIGVAQQAQYLQPGQAASQRVPISHTTRASPITVRIFAFLSPNCRQLVFSIHPSYVQSYRVLMFPGRFFSLRCFSFQLMTTSGFCEDVKTGKTK